ncbi:MAG TPA: FliA/WhiG family RNA polymerase sigma factor [Gemmatimonadaceae bacterium]|nr:FliA/WhiG family RNA polymerase sigma factor [Gemmatimonadaceae bacterium]
MDASELWTAYAAGDADARERLLDAHLGLVHFVARRILRNLSSEADFDELLSAGTLGLVAALESFDASRGHAFSTFAAPRIRGAILDELRRQDHVPRSIRRKTRDIGGVQEKLMRTLGRVPDDREVATELNVDLPTLWRWQSEIEGAVLVPLEGTPNARGETPAPAPAAALFDEMAVSAEDRLIQEQEVVALKDALRCLNEQERTVVSLYYYEELNLREIATVLEVTESRISQIRTKALAKLRVAVAPLRTSVA